MNEWVNREGKTVLCRLGFLCLFHPVDSAVVMLVCVCLLIYVIIYLHI